MTLRGILCPVDFSEPSRHALRWAGALAARHRSRLLVLNVVDPLLADAARMRFGLDLAKAEIEPELREFVGANVARSCGKLRNHDHRRSNRQRIGRDPRSRGARSDRPDRDGHAWAWRLSQNGSSD